MFYRKADQFHCEKPFISSQHECMTKWQNGPFDLSWKHKQETILFLGTKESPPRRTPFSKIGLFIELGRKRRQ